MIYLERCEECANPILEWSDRHRLYNKFEETHAKGAEFGIPWLKANESAIAAVQELGFEVDSLVVKVILSAVCLALLEDARNEQT